MENIIKELIEKLKDGQYYKNFPIKENSIKISKRVTPEALKYLLYKKLEAEMGESLKHYAKADSFEQYLSSWEQVGILEMHNLGCSYRDMIQEGLFETRQGVPYYVYKVDVGCPNCMLEARFVVYHNGEELKVVFPNYGNLISQDTKEVLSVRRSLELRELLKIAGMSEHIEKLEDLDIAKEHMLFNQVVKESRIQPSLEMIKEYVEKTFTLTSAEIITPPTDWEEQIALILKEYEVGTVKLPVKQIANEIKTLALDCKRYWSRAYERRSKFMVESVISEEEFATKFNEWWETATVYSVIIDESSFNIDVSQCVLEGIYTSEEGIPFAVLSNLYNGYNLDFYFIVYWTGKTFMMGTILKGNFVNLVLNKPYIDSKSELVKDLFYRSYRKGFELYTESEIEEIFNILLPKLLKCKARHFNMFMKEAKTSFYKREILSSPYGKPTGKTIEDKESLLEEIESSIPSYWDKTPLQSELKLPVTGLITKEELLDKIKETHKTLALADNEDPDDYPTGYYIQWDAYVEKDLSGLQYGNENFHLEQINVTKNNIPYAIFSAFGDWEETFYFIAYWDGSNLRAFIPKYGNVINLLGRSLYGNDWQEYNEPYNNKVYSDAADIICRLNINYNLSSLEEDEISEIYDKFSDSHIKSDINKIIEVAEFTLTINNKKVKSF